MSAIRKNTRKGFTLVEILIVVIILGILAAIVIPQFTNASTDARTSSLQSTLQTLRSQIQLYKLQHGDALPDLTGTTWTAFTTAAVWPTGGTTSYGPYMQSLPINPLCNLSTIVNGDGSAAASSAIGFVYDYGTSGSGTGHIFGTDSTGLSIAGTGTFGQSNFVAY